MSAPEVPKLGSPERPSEDVDTSDPFTTCKRCGDPIYSGEGWQTAANMHGICHERARKEFDEIPELLARLRTDLEKLGGTKT